MTLDQESIQKPVNFFDGAECIIDFQHPDKKEPTIDDITLVGLKTWNVDGEEVEMTGLLNMGITPMETELKTLSLDWLLECME